MKDESVFDCKKCGSCCMGEGGIVLGPRDLARLAAHFEVEETRFMAEYGQKHNGKRYIRTGPDGNCIFFRAGVGCGVHDVKPDVCRAWPFFRGNMVDAASLDMAREFCPGISSTATHAQFVAEGLLYLRAHNLRAEDPTQEAVALLPTDK